MRWPAESTLLNDRLFHVLDASGLLLEKSSPIEEKKYRSTLTLVTAEWVSEDTSGKWRVLRGCPGGLCSRAPAASPRSLLPRSLHGSLWFPSKRNNTPQA